MTENNPYTAPQSAVEDCSPGSMDKAERGTRLGAVILDGIILMIITFPLLWFYFSFFGMRVWTPVAGLRGFSLRLGALLIGTVVDFAVNGYLLYQRGQTIGKKICKIKIIKPDGTVPSLVDSYLKRRLLISFVQQIPILTVIVPLVDALLIFRNSHRCLHDDIANTLVVKV